MIKFRDLCEHPFLAHSYRLSCESVIGICDITPLPGGSRFVTEMAVTDRLRVVRLAVCPVEPEDALRIAAGTARIWDPHSA
jgi:hypothetical protein